MQVSTLKYNVEPAVETEYDELMSTKPQQGTGIF